MPRAAAAAALLLALVACGGRGLPAASDADAARASRTWPGTTTVDLEHGRSLYQSHCSVCHLPVEPRRFAPGEWPGHVAEMQTRAGLSPAEARLVEHYLVTMAQRAAAR